MFEVLFLKVSIVCGTLKLFRKGIPQTQKLLGVKPAKLIIDCSARPDGIALSTWFVGKLSNTL